MTNTIQSTKAVLSIFKDDWVVFLCATDIALQIDIDVLQTRGPGDGHWGKNTYQKINYTITLSGALRMNNTSDANFTGFDTLENIKGFVHLPFRISYIDDNSNTKSVQGQAMITGLNFGASVGSVVKNDVNFLGDGELMYFDGIFPCDSSITSITVTGQTAGDGTVHIAWTYTGAPYQVKYRIDNIGDYIYGLVDTALDIPSLSLGAHSIEMIPVCLNGYEGIGFVSNFVVTQGLTCSSAITDITITSTSATPVYSGTPTMYKYRIDGSDWTTVAITFAVPIASLSAGDHTIDMVPICSNGVEGTAGGKDFTIASQPAQSIINYSFSTIVTSPTSSLQIYVNGVLVVNENAAATGSIVAPTGSSVKAILTCPDSSGKHMNLIVQNTTTGIPLYHGINTSPLMDQYIFSPDGSTYSITGVIS